MDLIWHYTIGQRLQEIQASGVLRPATVGVPDHEVPVVWFSSRQDFEPTARKGLLGVDGSFRTLTVVETAKFGGGLIRFGIHRSSALAWKELCRAAGIRSSDRRRLERAGRAQGATVVEWFGVLRSVELSNIVRLEFSDSNLRWQEARSTPDGLWASGNNRR